MSRMIEYTPGQILGPHGLIYLEDAEWYIQASGKRVRQAKFECPYCEEHTHFIARIGNVKNGHTKSCGCLNEKARKERIIAYNNSNPDPWNKIHYNEGDEIGDNGVTYIKEYEERDRSPQGFAYRKCWFTCPVCGEPFVSMLSNVSRNKTKACGIHNSLGEEKISKYLSQLNINFETQKTFKDCYSEKGWPYKFDFYLPKYNCCIEYDGEQHFNARQEGFFTEDRVKDIQKRDIEKNKYCKDNNIYLIRIPYTEYNNLTKEQILNMLESL